MASIISAGTTDSTALNISSDRTGILQLASNNAVTAVTIDGSQNVGIGTASPQSTVGVNVALADTKGVVLQYNGEAKGGILLNPTAGEVRMGSINATGTYFTTFYSNNAERMRITSAGATQIKSTTGASPTYSFTNNGEGLLFRYNDDSGVRAADIVAIGNTPAGAAMNMRFWTNNTGTDAAAERMRIESSGNLRIGQTSGNSDARTSINGGSTDSSPCIDYVKNSATTSTAQVYARFTAGSTGTGSITANGAAAAAFTAWSDSRLKENITDLPSQLANIMALRPVEFDYVESMGGGHQIGFIVQDVQAIYPDLVGESSDGMLTLTDMNKNDARLIKAIQELKAINDTQAETINALIARIEALENK